MKQQKNVKSKGSNGNGSSNRIKDLVSEESPDDAHETSGEVSGSSGDPEGNGDEVNGNDAKPGKKTEGDKKKDLIKKLQEKTKKELIENREDLLKKACAVAANFTHGTMSLYPNYGARPMMRGKDDVKGRANNYETEGFASVSHALSTTTLKEITNPWTLCEDSQTKKSREASNMGHNVLAAGAPVHVFSQFDVNDLDASAKRTIEAVEGVGKSTDASVRALSAKWAADALLDAYTAETRGQTRTSHVGTFPCTVLVNMNFGQSPNPVGAFELAVEAKDGFSESEVSTMKLAKQVATDSKALGKLYSDCVKARGGDDKQRIAIYCQSDRREELLHDAGLKDCLVNDVSEIISKVLEWIDETRGAGGDNPLPRTIGLSMLKVYPVSNPNSDDRGRPKHHMFGGSLRLMISSQAVNAGRKARNYERLGDGSAPRSIRTTVIVDEILMRLGPDGHKDEAKEIVGAFVNVGWGPVKALKEPLAEYGDWQTQNGYHPGTDELDRAANLVKVNWATLIGLATQVVNSNKTTMENYRSALAEINNN